MKARTYIDTIIKTNSCSINTAEKLTNAMHREGLLHEDLALRFRMLYGDFDYMPQTWLDGDYKQNIQPFYTGSFKDPEDILAQAAKATEAYQNRAHANRSANMRIVKEDLTGCINRIATGAPETRYWVIAEPINETGICKEFATEDDAQEFIDRQRRKVQC